MPRRPPKVPAELGRAFSVGEGLAAGMARRGLRHTGLGAPVYGGRVREAVESLAERAAALAVVMEGDWAYSHGTAALLWDLPVPGRCYEADLHVIRPTCVSQVRRPGVVGHRGFERRTVVTRNGLPLTDPVTTWADLGALVGVDDLVVAADAILRLDPDLLLPLRAAAGVRRRRGARSLRAAAELTRVGSASAMETRARLAFLAAGLPEPELNAEIIEDGEWLARVDFLWRSARVIVEYEGDHHRSDRHQWQQDITRVRLLEAAGWRVIRITSADLHGAAFARLAGQLRLLTVHAEVSTPIPLVE